MNVPFPSLELKQLEWNKRKEKIDQRPSGWKGTCDSLAGVIYNCETKNLSEPIAPSYGKVYSPHCNNLFSPKEVLWTRTLKNGTVKRKRKCLRCGSRFSTVEIVLVQRFYELKG